MIFQSNVTDRQLFTNAQAAMIAAGISQKAYENAVKTQGYLRLIQPVVTGSQTINFPVLQNQTGAGNAVRSDEIRLPQQNAFFVGQWAMTIFKDTSPATYKYVPNTYPNAVTYTNAANYYGIYTGRLAVTIDQSVITRAYSLRKFLKIPATQLTAATNSPQDQFDGVDLLPVEPNIVFVGTAQIDVNVIFPVSLGTIDANSFICWDLFGIEAQNVALGAIQ
jgi:hypothetical protein